MLWLMMTCLFMKEDGEGKKDDLLFLFVYFLAKKVRVWCCVDIVETSNRYRIWSRGKERGRSKALPLEAALRHGIPPSMNLE
jgi:hypothetical protein